MLFICIYLYKLQFIICYYNILRFNIEGAEWYMMNDLINNVYLPDFQKRQVRDSDAYKLLKENNYYDDLPF